MELFEKEFKINKKLDCIILRPLFDIHYGAKSCDVEQLKKDIEWIRRRPNCYTWLGGDVIEAINMNDKRFELAGVMEKMQGKLNDLCQEQVKGIVKLLEPIKDRILFTLEGNHEEKVKKMYFYDCSKSIAEQLGVECKGYSCFFKLTFKYSGNGAVVKIYTHHGYGGGRKAPNKMTPLMELAMNFDANIFVMSHNHGIMTNLQPRLGLSTRGKTKLISKNILYVLGGTYSKTYQVGQTGYGEKSAYPVSHIGSNIIKIIPFPMEKGKYSHNGLNNSKRPEYYCEGINR